MAHKKKALKTAPVAQLMNPLSNLRAVRIPDRRKENSRKACRGKVLVCR